MAASHFTGPVYSANGFVGDITGNITLPTGLTLNTLIVNTTSTFTGISTFTAQPIFSSLTASSSVATDASKGLISVANTGTGNNVLALAPDINALRNTHTPVVTNGSLSLTGAQASSGYIATTPSAHTNITLPTGTDLGTFLGAVQGTVFDLYFDSTAGSGLTLIVVAVNGIRSAGALAAIGAFGNLGIPSGVTGQGKYTLMFSSPTAYTFSRTA
jgi:hypothetical protein